MHGHELPLQVRGGPVDLSYRFTRGFGETAQVEVSYDGRAVDQFQCRGGTVLERKAALGVLPATPVRVGIVSDSHERKDRGLKMDWIRLTLGPGAHLRLTGWAALVPAVTVALVQGNVPGVGRHLPASASAKVFFPDIVTANLRQPKPQIFPIEMRMPPRHGKSSNIHEQANVMGLQHARELSKVANGVPNGEDGGHKAILFTIAEPCIHCCLKPRTVPSLCPARSGP
jgi:hypothetical protein